MPRGAPATRAIACVVALAACAACGAAVDGPADARADDSGADAAAPRDARAPVRPVVSFWIDGPAGPRPVAAVRVDEPFRVRVTGLPLHARATLHSYLAGYHGRASFVAHGGDIDTARDGAAAGTYVGLDPDGLLWSMVRDASVRGDPLDVRVAVEFEGALVAEAALHRRALGDGLRTRRLDDEGLAGVLWAPDDGAPHPAVIVLGGAEGGVEAASARAAHLASHGFTALGLAYFGAGALPRELATIPLEYFGRALAWLARQPEVDAAHVGVLGTSRGGELALQLAAMYPAISAVVAEVPSHVRWPAPRALAREAPAWTHGGVALPALATASAVMPAAERLSSGATGYRLAPLFAAAMAQATPDDLAAATIPVEHTRGPVLLIGAVDDGVWPSCAFAAAAIERLRATGHATRHAQDQALCLAEAGHRLGPPGWPTTDTYAEQGADGAWAILGGTPAGTARAQREATSRVIEFLATALQ